MANETVTATVTGIINTSLISKVINNYAIDANVALQHMRIEPLQPGTKTAAFAIPTKSSAGAVTEADGMTAGTLTFANTTVAVSEVGVLRTVSKLASRTNMLGDAGLYNFVIEDGARLCLEKMETDAWSQWTNASTSVGTSGADFTPANYAGALSQLFINKARGNGVFLLSATQLKNLRAALIASAATHLSNGEGASIMGRTGDNGYAGRYLGADVYASNLAQASSSDKVGICMIDGAANPANAATGVALGWMPEPEVLGSASLPGRQIAVTCAYGMAEIADFNYVKIVTVA